MPFSTRRTGSCSMESSTYERGGSKGARGRRLAGCRGSGARRDRGRRGARRARMAPRDRGGRARPDGLVDAFTRKSVGAPRPKSEASWCAASGSAAACATPPLAPQVSRFPDRRAACARPRAQPPAGLAGHRVYVQGGRRVPATYSVCTWRTPCRPPTCSSFITRLRSRRASRSLRRLSGRGQRQEDRPGTRSRGCG